VSSAAEQKAAEEEDRAGTGAEACVGDELGERGGGGGE